MKRWIHSTSEIKTYIFEGDVEFEGRPLEYRKPIEVDATSEKQAIQKIKWVILKQKGMKTHQTYLMVLDPRDVFLKYEEAYLGKPVIRDQEVNLESDPDTAWGRIEED